MGTRSRLRTTLEMIKFEHTVFALPFALISTLLAADGLPTAWQASWIMVAMVGARSAAMTFNRIVDLRFDAANPRTSGRALPAGELSMGFAIGFTVIASLAFILAAGMLNRLCLVLSIPVLAILFGYSYTKRFTPLSHLFLGFAIGLAPLGAWIAIRGEFAVVPVLLTGVVTLWIGGFDIIYACQDAEFDERARLFSMPSNWGLPAALAVSTAFHAGAVALLVTVAVVSGLGTIGYAGIAIVAAILFWEHRIVAPDDLSRVDVAFFNLNGYVSVLLLAAVATDVLLQ